LYTRAHDTHDTHQQLRDERQKAAAQVERLTQATEDLERSRNEGVEPQGKVVSGDKSEDGSCSESTETEGGKSAMRITQDDALSLLGKYVEERTLVLAVFGTHSHSVARVTGAIRVSVDGRGPHLLVGKDDDKADQIKFRLSDCVFGYGDFRDEDDKYEGFLVVASAKGDTLSLFEPKG
jgi:hypothetical protein